MKSPARRTVITGACATVATLLVKTEAVARDPQLEYIQALVSDLRNVTENMPMCVYVAFQETADRLEALPGIVPVPNATWQRWKAKFNKSRLPGPYLATGRA